MEIISQIHGTQGEKKPIVLNLGKTPRGKLELWAEDSRGQIIGDLHVFSSAKFANFFGEAITSSPNELTKSVNLSSRSKIEIIESVVESLSEEEMEDVKLQSEIEEKLTKLVGSDDLKSEKKLEALERIWGLEQPFLARDFKENTYYANKEAQSLLQSLKNQGFLKNSKVEHPEDGRINYEYRISEKAKDYINHFSER